ncbi:hypothetical protein BE20_00805 [Sorangium cellulosum]|uniref:Uncharacterized protein n=1 Tax=Sorangium cellulosum TaxID=56 RepID=A0A150SPQ9_SORCE|nr:hypothetical protein BE18_18645 [Sorangium cellulosum]KYF94228.1 hypothetical protein BE20_00805 [Sorangium cellulosum]
MHGVSLPRALVACIADPVSVGIEPIGIHDTGAVVIGIQDAVVVPVIVTGIADVVMVVVVLIGVRHERAVVQIIELAIAVPVVIARVAVPVSVRVRLRRWVRNIRAVIQLVEHLIIVPVVVAGIAQAVGIHALCLISVVLVSAIIFLIRHPVSVEVWFHAQASVPAARVGGPGGVLLIRVLDERTVVLSIRDTILIAVIIAEIRCSVTICIMRQRT